jgi:thioredoxin reductase (NADPH)
MSRRVADAAFRSVEADTRFPVLDPAEIAFLDALGERRSTHVGEYLYRSGDESYDFFVVVSGAVDIVLDAADDGAPHLIVRQRAGRFLGELNLLTRQRVYVSARVAEPGEVIRVPSDEIRRVIATNARLGDTILTAFMARREGLLSSAASSIRLLGSRFRAETRALREFLTRSRIPHEWLDPDQDPVIEQLLVGLDLVATDQPVVITSGAILRQATPGTVAEHLGLTVDRLPDRCFDLVIVGGGPAGLAAAVYGASEGLRTLALDTLAPGGQAGTSSRIENYLGFPTGISGGDLTQRALVQAEKFGARLSSPCAATSLREQAGHLVVGLADGTDVAGGAVIVASGARYRKLPVDGLEQFDGNGVYYAATETEARACGTGPVVVVGGGNSAGQAAMYLADNGNDVTVVIRKADLGATMSRYLVDRIDAHPDITVRANSTITALDGDASLRTVRVNDATGDTALPCVGLFSFIGADPATEWLSGCAALDDHGFVLTDRSLAPSDLDARWPLLDRRPLPYETSHPGLFAVGDVRAGSIKRVAAAVGEGSAAVRSVHEYLAFAY